MKVYSDKLRAQDLVVACPDNVSLFILEPMPRVKLRARGWVVSLTGTSPYTSQMGELHKAATYIEHGHWMAKLFDRDPNAIISNYRGRQDFQTKTREFAERVGQYRGGDAGRYDDPWNREERGRATGMTSDEQISYDEIRAGRPVRKDLIGTSCECGAPYDPELPGYSCAR